MPPAGDEIPTLTFEGVKYTMNQTKDGVKVTLVIHPNEVPVELLSDPIGSRYRVVMVLLDDDEQPKPRQAPAHHLTEGEEAVRSASLLAKNPDFQKWVIEKGIVGERTEEAAAQAIRTACGVKSRSEFARDEQARMRFNMMRFNYSRSIPTRR